MKTIVIPKRFGYPTMDIFINGKKYLFNTGVEIEVDDRIAKIIENAIELEPKEDGSAEANAPATVAKVLAQTYFRGWFDTDDELKASVATPNDYAYSMESGTVWDYIEGYGWKDRSKDVPILTGQAEKTQELQNQISLNTQALFQNGLKYTQDITQEYQSRATADGANILDGSAAVLKKIEGNTIAHEGSLKSASFGGIAITGVNLFYPNRTNYPNDTWLSPDMQRDLSKPYLFRGMSASGYYSVGNVSMQYANGVLEFTTTGGGYGVGFNIPCAPNQKYAISFKNLGDTMPSKNVGFFKNGVCIGYQVNVGETMTAPTPQDCDQLMVVFANDVAGTFKITDIQVQIGTTATAYTPYVDPSLFAFPKVETPLGRTIDFEQKKIVDYGVSLTVDNLPNYSIGANQYPSAYIYGLMPDAELHALGVATMGKTAKSVFNIGDWMIGSNSRTLQWIGCFAYLGLDKDWVDKNNPTDSEKATALAALNAYLSANPVYIRYISSTMQSETPFTAEQISAGNTYSVRTGGMEEVLGNDGAEYGAENTLTQNYIMIKEST